MNQQQRTRAMESSMPGSKSAANELKWSSTVCALVLPVRVVHVWFGHAAVSVLTGRTY